MIDLSEYVKPKCSVYGILYLHEWPKSMVNVGKYYIYNHIYIYGASGKIFPCFPIIVWAVLNHDCLEPRTIMTEIYHGHFYRRQFPCLLARKVITARPEKMML